MAEVLTTNGIFKKYTDGDSAWGPGTRENWDTLDDLFIRHEGSGTPVGVVTPDFIGQPYRDTATNDRYIAFGAGPTQWAGIYSDAHTWLKGQKAKWVQLSGASVTPDLAAGNFFFIQLTAATTINNPINISAALDEAGTFTIIIKQDAVDRTISWGANYKWPQGIVPLQSSGNGKIDLATFVVTEDGLALGSYVNEFA